MAGGNPLSGLISGYAHGGSHPAAAGGGGSHPLGGLINHYSGQSGQGGQHFSRSGYVAPPAPQHHGGGGAIGGVGGFFSHLGSDAERAITGIPTGVETIGKAAFVDPAKALYGVATGNQKEVNRADKGTAALGSGLAKQYKQTYSPLVHGHFSEFGHKFYEHPLGPILDALTVATLGAGGLAKAGKVAADAGLIDRGSALARLSTPEKLDVPSFGTPERITVKETSHVPLVKLRQQLVHAGLNKLPPETPLVGSTARGVRALGRISAKEGSRLEIQARDFNQAFNKLTKPERVAWHLRARALNPTLYKRILEGEPKSSQAMKDLLGSPEAKAAFEKPSAHLVKALEHGRNLSERLTALRVAAGHIDEQTALEAPYRHLRLASGAKVGPNGLEGGVSIEKLAKMLDEQGVAQPFHVADTAGVKGMRSAFSRKPSGYAAPEQGVKGSRLVLARHGLINFTENSLGKSFGRFKGQAEAQLLHDELVKHAAILPQGEPVPFGWEELKLNRGQAAAPFTQRVASRLERELHPPGVAERVKGLGRVEELQPRNVAGRFEEPHRLIVPSQVKRLVEDESKHYLGRFAALRQHAFLAPWKAMVLGLRPAFFGNVTIGNSILGALQMAPGRYGLLGWLNQVLPGFEKVAGKALTEDTMKEVFPEQVTGTLGSDVTHGLHYHGDHASLRVASRVAQGVTPAMIRYENVLRRALAEGWAKANPEVQRLMRGSNGDVNAALRKLAKRKPETIDAISRRVDNALGNYRTYNRFERAIKSIVPFYGWNRHVTQSLFRLASERPQELDALLNVGDNGRARADRLLGALPSYLEGSIPVHLPGYLGGQKGATTVLNPTAWNPFTTIVDEGRMAAFPFTKAGTSSDAFPLAPDVAAGIEQLTGHNLLTGAPMKQNAFLDELEHLSPQLNVLTRGTPKPTAVNQNRAVAQLLRLLGLPVENLNLGQAHYNVAKYGPNG